MRGEPARPGMDETDETDETGEDVFDDPVARPAIEPEPVDAENAAFVVVGALVAVGVVVGGV